MMNYIVLEGAFDPVTQSELEYARSLIRKGYDLVVFAVAETGVLPKETRTELLKAAIRPFRKYGIGEGFEHSKRMDQFAEEEKAVRNGAFYKAAQGIRHLLVEQGLYFEEVLKANCRESRVRHSLSVAKVSEMLARIHGADEKKARMAGLMHDITKNKDAAYHNSVIRIYEPELSGMHPDILHSFTAPVWLKQNLGMHDYRILRAIHGHTLGDDDSKLGKILFVADKIEPTRGYDTEKELALCMKDLDAGFALVRQEAQTYVENHR